ncbi:hypothetical protein [Flavihumibacter sp. CACIAM 22H1]|uniref:hypothetical protein n=1 Tax=Flavihumibacter sp. CACIAM 22H1 TaxID=1812911 RepID=UPI0007A7CAB1|nr:hypothetical protein [Flavihumibacter sp. CACIAM 22H1]KYP16288.1 MAG: hypothetical protein A1D16_20330 [Flavihumibacter sp. CACIAM 22H1]
MKNLLIGGLILGESPAGTSWKLDLQQHKDCIIRKIYTADPAAANSIRQAFPDAELVFEGNELLEDQEISLVLVVPPLPVQAPSIGKMLASGKHVRIV